MAKPIEFGVLGPLQVLRAGKDLTPSGAREQTLIAALAMRVGEVVTVPELMEILWGEHPPRSGSKAVQGAVSRARAELGRWKDVIARRDGGYVLDVPPEHVDAAWFAMLVEQARAAIDESDVAEAAGVLREALAQWRAEEPCDLGDTIAARAQMRVLIEHRLAAYEDLFEAALAVGEHESLVSEIDRLLERHPHRERLWGHLMLALYRSGRRSEALAAFGRMRERLAEEFGLDPSPDLRDLEERMLAQDPTLELMVPGEPVDLPEEVTPFVGREPEIDALLGLLEKPGLVTITGIGGVGKTRLALHMARAMHPFFGGAVLWRTARDGPPTILAERTLLVLDGCDGSARSSIERALEEHPGLTVLTTCPVPIGIEGEHVVRIEPMVVSIGGPSPALRMFVDRARAADPWFDPADERSIGDICAQVGGLPLAIELAATCAVSMAPAELMARLTERFPDAVEVGLDDTLAWVWDRLTGSEQRALARAATFSGPFTVGPMERICEGAEAVVPSLAARALLQRDGEWFRIPTAARPFMLARLSASGDEEVARRRHAAAMAELAERLGEDVTGAREADAVHEIEAWLPELRVAFEHALSRRDADLALRIPYALRWYALFRASDDVFGWARAAGLTFERADHPLVAEVLGCAALREPALIERAVSAAATRGRPEPVLATFADATAAAQGNDYVRALARADALTSSDDAFAARYWRGARVSLLKASGAREEAVRAMNAYRLAATRLACPSLRAVALHAFADVVRESDPETAESMEHEARALAESVGNVMVRARALR